MEICMRIGEARKKSAAERKEAPITVPYYLLSLKEITTHDVNLPTIS